MTPSGQAATLVPDRREGNGRLAAVFSVLVSVALLVVIADQFRQMNFTTIAGMVPRDLTFYVVFAAYYLAVPFSEWIIYRRLWQLPVDAIGALMRKLVSNELLLGYLGEAQFYAWARQRIAMTAAPFGTIKDVTILSALTGNVVTLVMLAVAWPLLNRDGIGLELRSVFISLGVVLAISFAIGLFRQRLFTLPRQQLRFIAMMHFMRIGVMLGLAAVMWHLVLPAVPVMIWLVLATLRMLVSRLPLVPNKDVVFAGMAVFLLGKQTDVASLMAMMAGLILIAHLVTGTIFGLAGLVGDRKRQES